VSIIEPHSLDHLPGLKWIYRSWQELEQYLFALAVENQQIAMEYSPYQALPSVSKVDAGVVDLLRRYKTEVVSSANLLQKYTSVWTEDQWKSHQEAAHVLEEVVDETWAFIYSALSSNLFINEYQVQQFMLEQIHQRTCVTENPPICAVNAHSADPHYTPSSSHSLPIQIGDFILLDLWCKKQTPRSVYADISRVGVASHSPQPFQKEIFDLVKTARDHTTDFIRQRYQSHTPVQGWEVDQFCRDLITQANYGVFFIHRTGHNIGESVHGPGANLDNLETHDFRLLIPNTCFSVEPGIYLPEQFGIRLEYDVYLHPSGDLSITGGIQNKIICLMNDRY
jgi:Xaa-Pro dipeptidase